MVKIISMILAIIAVFVILYYNMIWMHENAHAAACKYYGGNATIEITPILDGNSYCNISTPKLVEAFIVIDIVGYHIIAATLMVSVLLFIIIIIQLFNAFLKNK